jgi:mannose-6-phosphate isomerase-like protein (cupin superfamily)
MKLMKNFKQWTIENFKSRGYTLTPLELHQQAPFEVKRIYTITNFSADAKTGEHCHKIEEEVFVQIQGNSTLILDRGEGKEEIPMEAGAAVYIPNWVWHGFKNASSDAVILALSSTNYGSERDDYIENHELYLAERP